MGSANPELKALIERLRTVRQTLEHVLYWDRHSIDTLQAEFEQVGPKEP